MFDDNQIVKVKWNNTNREWYESKGYIYTKRYDLFDVYVKDLSPRSNIKIRATCDYCGEDYETCFVVLMDGRKSVPKDCCSKCTGKKSNDLIRNKRANKYIELAKEICDECGYILLTTVDDYTDIKMNIDFICLKHGKQSMSLDNFIHGHRCKMCGYENVSNSLKHDIQYVKECIESINGNKLINPDDYKDSLTRNLNIKCSCGNIFTTSFVNYTKHGVNTCYSCSCKESIGEKCIREYLELNKIKFIQEKRFDGCRDNKPLPFDFYLPYYNLIIEFDGRQHYESIFGDDNFAQTQKHDKIKNQYCENKGIDLLRIPYWDGNNITKILDKQLNL